MGKISVDFALPNPQPCAQYVISLLFAGMTIGQILRATVGCALAQKGSLCGHRAPGRPFRKRRAIQQSAVSSGRQKQFPRNFDVAIVFWRS
jgi:hypothetical protein